MGPGGVGSSPCCLASAGQLTPGVASSSNLSSYQHVHARLDVRYAEYSWVSCSRAGSCSAKQGARSQHQSTCRRGQSILGALAEVQRAQAICVILNYRPQESSLLWVSRDYSRRIEKRKLLFRVQDFGIRLYDAIRIYIYIYIYFFFF